MTQLVSFTIETNAIDAKHFLDRLARDQLPFAMSRTVNRLAYDIKDIEQGRLDDYFDIRTNWLTKRGAMPVIPSRKTQYPNIYSVLGVKDEIAALAVTGGERPKSMGEMAVPFSDSGDGLSARSILNPGRETLTKKTWPSRIVKKNSRKATKRRGRARKAKPFYLETSGGKRFVAVRKEGKRYPLRILYGFKSDVTIPQSWPLIENAQGYVLKKYDVFLTEEITKAIRTAKI